MTKATWESFELQMLSHIQRFFPVEWKLLGKDGAKQLVSVGSARALRHGFRKGRHIARYVDHMLVLGGGFDDDPQLPWASQILHLKGEKPPDKVLEELTAAALAHLKAVTGERGELYVRALRAARAIPLEKVPVFVGNPVQSLATWFERIYPEKARVVNLKTFGPVALVRARAHKLGEAQPFFIYATLMLLLGWRFDEDPAMPWAAEALANKTLSPYDLSRQLRQRGIEWLDRAWAPVH